MQHSRSSFVPTVSLPVCLSVRHTHSLSASLPLSLSRCLNWGHVLLCFRVSVSAVCVQMLPDLEELEVDSCPSLHFDGFDAETTFVDNAVNPRHLCLKRLRLARCPGVSDSFLCDLAAAKPSLAALRVCDNASVSTAGISALAATSPAQGGFLL